MAPTIQIENNKSLINDSSTYACSILLGKNYLSFTLTDAAFSTIYSLKHFKFEDRIIGKNDFDEILSDASLKNIAQVKIGIDSLKSTLIPSALYDKEHNKEYIAFLHDVAPEEVIHSMQINELMTSVYTLKKSTVSFLLARLNKVTFYDASACFLTTYPSLLFNEFTHTFFLCIKDDSSSLSVYAEKKLVLHQVYSSPSNLDLVYFISNFIAQHQLDKNMISIQVNGESKRVEACYDELSNYYKSVKYSARPQSITFPEGLYAYPSHYFLNLFSLITCE